MLADKPALTVGEAEALALQVYGLAAVAAVLPGERDQNFRLDVDGHPAYVLKIANSTELPAVLAAQHEAAALARAAGLAVQRLVPTAAGEASAEHGEHIVRLLGWLPGAAMASLPHYPPELLRDLGSVLGRLTRALAGYDHPGAHRDFHWDVARAGTVVAGLRGAVSDPARGAMVDAFCERFSAEVAPALAGLRRAVIHGDANDLNVLVDSRARVCGLLDFGDLVHSHVVAEPAVAAAYVVHGSDDPLTDVCHLVAGFHAQYPLAEAELDVLWDLVVAREFLSACHAAAQGAARPDDPYLTISEEPAWDALERMRDVHPRLARYRLRDACGMDPYPDGAAVRSFLQATDPAPLLAGLPGLRLFAVDLSAASTTVRADEAGAPPARFDALIRSVVDGDLAAVGVGGYGEQRLIYTGAEYVRGGDLEAERRTVHLAVDVWTPAGAEVCAPLPGTVAVVHDNDSRLDYGPVVILKHSTDEGATFFSLYGHLATATLSHLQVGQRVAAGAVIGWVGTPPTNGDWAPHVHVQLILDLLDLAHDYPGVCLASQRSTWLGLSPDPGPLLRFTVPGRSRH